MLAELLRTLDASSFLPLHKGPVTFRYVRGYSPTTRNGRGVPNVVLSTGRPRALATVKQNQIYEAMSITEETQSVYMTGIVTELKKIQERLQALENIM